MTSKMKQQRLPMYLSCRVVLSDEQRSTLKTAYHQQLKELSPQPARIGGSIVSTSTAVNHPFQHLPP